MGSELIFVGIRIIAFCLVVPVFSAVRVGILVRLLVALVLWFFLLPYVGATLNLTFPKLLFALSRWQVPLHAAFVERACSEAVIGILLALVVGAVLWGMLIFAGWFRALLFAQFEEQTLLEGSTTAEGSEQSNIVFGLGLLTVAVLMHSQAVELLLEPLVVSFNAYPVTEISAEKFTSATHVVIEMLLASFRFALVLAIPFFLISFLSDFLHIILHRLCAPLLPSHVVQITRSLALVIVLSFGLLYLEYSTLEFSQRWSYEYFAVE